MRILSLILMVLSQSVFGAATGKSIAAGADDKEVMSIINRSICSVFPIDEGFLKIVYDDGCIYTGKVTAEGTRSGFGELWNLQTKELFNGYWVKGNLFGRTQITKHTGDRFSPVIHKSSEWRANGSPLRVDTPSPGLTSLSEDKGADRGSSSSSDYHEW